MRFLTLLLVLTTTSGCINLDALENNTSPSNPVQSGTPGKSEDRVFQRSFFLPEWPRDDLYLASKNWLISRSTAGDMDILYEDPAIGRIMAKQGLEFRDRAVRFYFVSIVTVDVNESAIKIEFSEPYATRLSEYSSVQYSPLTTEYSLKVVRNIWESQVSALPAYVERTMATWNK